MSERGHVMQPSFAPQSALTRGSTGRYSLVLTGFLVALAVTLLTVVDMRRAFFLAPSAYSKLGAPSAFLNYTPWHVVVLIVAVSAAWGCYRLLRREEAILGATSELRRMRNIMATVVMLFLIVDLFIYRGVQAERIAEAHRLGISQTFNLAALPSWLRPLGEAANFLLVVWHATLLGILIGALFLVLLCTSQRLKRTYGLTGFRAHLLGGASAVAYPFCSCCAGPLGASLYRGGASLESTLSLAVGAPLLNITTLFLATTLLPADFALLRIVGAVLLTVFGTWLVTRAVRERPPVVVSASQQRSLRLLERLIQPFAFERVAAAHPVETPSDLVRAWLRTAWAIGRVAVPTLFIAAAVIGWVAPILLSLGGGNDLATVVIAALLGVLFMVPTWTELAIAGPLIQQGLTGPAAALLLALPAVSLPSLVILGAALRSWRIPLALVLVVLVASVLAGILFV